jgi:hypothetical protein
MEYNIKLKVYDQDNNLLEESMSKNQKRLNMTIGEIKELVDLSNYPNVTSTIFKVNGVELADTVAIDRFSFLTYTVNCTI